MVTLSSQMIQDMASQETGEAVLVLLTIEHADLVTPIRVTSDGVQTISNGNTFEPCPFRIVLPAEVENEPFEMQLEIDNVDRRVIDTLRTLKSSPTVRVQVVRASTPDTIEYEAFGFELKGADADMYTVRGRLVRQDLISEPYPAGRFTPYLFPGLYV